MKHHKSVHAIIIYKNKYFIQKRDNNENIHFPDFWGLFGGKILKNEDKFSGITRELKEETNLDLDRPEKNIVLLVNSKDIGQTRNITYFVFYLKKLPSKIKIYEGSNYKFSSFESIKKMKFNPFDFAALSFHYYQKIKKKNLIPKKFLKKKRTL